MPPTHTIAPRFRAPTRTSPQAAELLAKVRDGGRINTGDADLLYREATLTDLGGAAYARRQALVPGTDVTYLVDRNINYTNVCITDCSFCSFYRVPGHPESYTLSRDQITAKIQELIAIGGTRILMQGGHNPGLPLTWYEEILTWLKRDFPSIQLDCFSPSEIGHLSDLEGIPMLEVLTRLKAAGLDGLPGGGGEILDDEIRTRISPKKQMTAGWLEAMEHAQRLGLTTSSTQVIGFGEELRHRLAHMERLREHQDRALAEHGNGFTAFISWTVQLENNSMGASRHRTNFGTGGQGYLRHLAIGRIYLDNIPHHQASWPTQGVKLAQVGLDYGADDFGSTMLEENVVSSAGTKLRSVAELELQRGIADAGFTPVQRDSSYNSLRVIDEVPAAAAPRRPQMQPGA
jgi:cyclic dehypoxanthinyl futalosine synthase